MRYTHIAAGHPQLQWEHVRQQLGDQVTLTREIRTDQATVLVLESDEQIGTAVAADLTQLGGSGIEVGKTPGLWLLFANCDAARPRQSYTSL